MPSARLCLKKMTNEGPAQKPYVAAILILEPPFFSLDTIPLKIVHIQIYRLLQTSKYFSTLFHPSFILSSNVTFSNLYPTLQPKLHLCIPRKGIAWPQSQFPQFMCL
jgi:hypothetical protein